jgi:hypothetical protein
MFSFPIKHDRDEYNILTQKEKTKQIKQNKTNEKA